MKIGLVPVVWFGRGCIDIFSLLDALSLRDRESGTGYILICCQGRLFLLACIIGSCWSQQGVSLVAVSLRALWGAV